MRQIVCGGFHSFILKESGELFAFGYNDYGQLGLGDNNNRNEPTLLMIDKQIRQVVCGWAHHTFILKESGELIAFGNNYCGQLGLGDNKSRNKPTLLMTDNNIVSINGIAIEKIKWSPDIYTTLSKTKQKEIKNFLFVCHYYKQIYKINMVKYMKHAIISLLF